MFHQYNIITYNRIILYQHNIITYNTNILYSSSSKVTHETYHTGGWEQLKHTCWLLELETHVCMGAQLNTKWIALHIC